MNKFVRISLLLFLLLAAIPFIFFGAVGWFCYRAVAYGPVAGRRLIDWGER